MRGARLQQRRRLLAERELKRTPAVSIGQPRQCRLVEFLEVEGECCQSSSLSDSKATSCGDGGRKEFHQFSRRRKRDIRFLNVTP